MSNIVSITFNRSGRKHFYSSNGLELKKGMLVIVDTDRGIQAGEVFSINKCSKNDTLACPLKKVVRVATKKDRATYDRNHKDAKAAIKQCERLVRKHNLDMRLVEAFFTFDRKQLIFYFLADNRVDFRELAKDLAQIYKTRIELRQIGVRDKAKETGGIGPCGRMLCCSRFLSEFDSVSINMAKNQNLALNPAKINGVCGRLLCCLNYEDGVYKENRRKLPDEGSEVKVKGVRGKVVAVNILNKSYVVDIQSQGKVEVKVEK